MIDKLAVDGFAGGGGASTGIEMALGRSVDIAINHDPEAIAMHRINHPQTRHYCESIQVVDPLEATEGKPVGLAWFSPDCKHFSKAKGGALKDKNIRGLAWVIIHWVNKVRPEVIPMENVEEFQTWGPLLPDGSINPKCKGWFFQCFVGALRRRGYKVEWRELVGADYGAATIRKRLFLIARCDGKPIVWPKPAHSKVVQPRLKKWRSASECIDWSIPCPSIFERKKPLAEATLKRVAKGLVRYVIEAKEPFFITECANASSQRNMSLMDPLRTQCAQVKGGHFALVSGLLTKFRTGATGSSLNEPVHTITAGGYIKRPAGAGHAMGLVSATLIRQFGESASADIMVPMPTIMANGMGKTQLLAASMCKMRGDNVGSSLFDPLHTVSAGGTHHALVAAFLAKYYGSGDSVLGVNEPLHTVTSKDRFSLVTVVIDGETYVITDIGLRMLQPKELYAAQGFPRDYIFDRGRFVEGGRFFEKKLTKTAQVRMVGNSVCPDVAAALVAANVPEMCVSSERKVVA